MNILTLDPPEPKPGSASWKRRSMNFLCRRSALSKCEKLGFISFETHSEKSNAAVDPFITLENRTRRYWHLKQLNAGARVSVSYFSIRVSSKMEIIITAADRCSLWISFFRLAFISNACDIAGWRTSANAYLRNITTPFFRFHSSKNQI